MRLGTHQLPITISSDRYNRILFDNFGDFTGFDAAYLLAEDGSILEVIAEPEARTELSNDWDEAAFIETIDRWIMETFEEDVLDELELQIFPEGQRRYPTALHKIEH